jgi:LPS-assembly lipoprotein
MLIRNLLLVTMVTLLSACGFQLRGTGDMQFGISEIALSARNAYGDLTRDVQKALQNNGVRVHDGAPWQLVLTNEQQTSRTVGFTSTARSAELELSSTLDFEIRSRNNLLLLGNQIDVQRNVVQDQNNLAGSTELVNRTRREMRQALVQQLMSSLQAMTDSQLETLQQEAEARAKAEAEALEAARKTEEAELATQPESIRLPGQ